MYQEGPDKRMARGLKVILCNRDLCPKKTLSYGHFFETKAAVKVIVEECPKQSTFYFRPASLRIPSLHLSQVICEERFGADAVFKKKHCALGECF